MPTEVSFFSLFSRVDHFLFNPIQLSLAFSFVRASSPSHRHSLSLLPAAAAGTAKMDASSRAAAGSSALMRRSARRPGNALSTFVRRSPKAAATLSLWALGLFVAFLAPAPVASTFLFPSFLFCL